MNKFVITRIAQERFKMCAPGKAPSDCGKIFEINGFTNITFVMPQSGIINKIISSSRQFLALLKTIRRNDSVVIQYPVAPMICKFLYIFGRRDVSLLIHDIESIRRGRVISSDDMFSFKMAKFIIVHSEAMMSFLSNLGISSSMMIVLEFFDYLTSYTNKEKREKSNEVCFCGNLVKSNEFIKKIKNSSILESVSFNMYGSSYFDSEKNVMYKGSFKPEQLDHIHGSWGLVWDGNSIEGCEGALGNYLKINAPHKMSLYIAAELPIICWAKSASAKLVQKYGIGIVVENLKQLPYLLENVSEQDYFRMLENIKVLSEKVRKGDVLYEIIKKVRL